MEKSLVLIPGKDSATFSIDGELYHSRFAPVREAEKFVDTLALNNNSICVLLAPGFDYLSSCIGARYPGSRCISLQPKEFAGVIVPRSPHRPNDSIWYEGQDDDVASLLRDRIPDEDVMFLELVIWPPARRCFGEFCERIGNEVNDFARMAVASFNTVSFFGKRWLRNISANLTNLDQICTLPETNGKLIIAGSGPGLEDCLSLLSEYRDRYILWALPSALRALQSFNIPPDVVVSSDAGYWAGLHLEYLYRIGPHTAGAPIVIAPGRAMLRPVWNGWPGKVVLCSMKTELERLIDKSCRDSSGRSLYSLELSDRGSVALTALDLVRMKHHGEVLTIGLDFAWRDMQSHVRPHTFEESGGLRESRLNGKESMAYQEREHSISLPAATTGWQRTATLDIYRNWLCGSAQPGGNTILDYNPSGVRKPMPSITLDRLGKWLSEGNKPGEPRRLEPEQVPAKELRRSLVKRAWNDIKFMLMNADPDSPACRELCIQLIPFDWKDFRKGRIDRHVLQTRAVQAADDILSSLVHDD